MSEYKEIPLGKSSHVVLVDAVFYVWLMQWKWCAARRGDKIYATTNIIDAAGHRTQMLMHRLILGLKPKDGRFGDHKDPNNTLDNRLSNLRIATPKQNTHNVRMHKDNKSGLKGVSWSTAMNRWGAHIYLNGKQTSLGYFVDKFEAHQAYCKAATAYFGEFARVA